MLEEVLELEKDTHDVIKGTTHTTSLKIAGYNDYKPEQHKCYFGIDNKNTLQTDDRELPILIIGVAFYNETAVELRRTLVSLADQVQELQNHAICQVVFVSDGHGKWLIIQKNFSNIFFVQLRNMSDIGMN